jgi:hypothetical protein
MQRKPRSAALVVAARAGLVGLAALLAGSLLVPTAAQAYCRTRVDSTKAKKDGDPASDEANQCWGTGPQIYWRSRCIGYELYKSANRVSLEDARAVLSAAFAKWTQTSCALADEPGKNPNARISLDVRDLGNTDCAKAGNPEDKEQSGYNKEGPNQNVIIFRDDSWPYGKANDPQDDSSRTLGLTTVTYDPQTGEIHDADMELNTYDSIVKVTNIGPSDYDLSSIVTHEAGHFLGIAHSNDSTSTMYFEYQPGETRKQFLKLDDINAICEAYAPGDVRFSGDKQIPAGVCDPTPEGGIQRSCADDDKGCAVTTPGAAGEISFWSAGGFGLACAVAAIGRRLKLRRARP